MFDCSVNPRGQCVIQQNLQWPNSYNISLIKIELNYLLLIRNVVHASVNVVK